MFAETFGFKFQERKQRMLTIWEQGAPKRFEELVIRRITWKGRVLTVSVIRAFASQEATIYFKGPLRLLLPFLRPDYRSGTDPNSNHINDINQFSKDGMHAVGIAKCELDASHTAELVRDLNERQSIYKDDASQKDALLMEFARDLELLGFLGLKKTINNRNTLMVEELRKNGVKLCILSADEATTNITDLNAMKLF